MPSDPQDVEVVIVGLDVGGTKTRAVGFDSRFNALVDVRMPTGVGSVAKVAASILAARLT